METNNIYRQINKDVVEIQKILQDENNWHEEIEDYLMDNGYIKHIFRREKNNEEIWYEKNEISVESYNDIEVSFEYKGSSILFIERDDDYKVTVRFEC